MTRYDLAELEKIVVLADSGCLGRCSGSYPTFCDPCEALHELKYEIKTILELIEIAKKVLE